MKQIISRGHIYNIPVYVEGSSFVYREKDVYDPKYDVIKNNIDRLSRRINKLSKAEDYFYANGGINLELELWVKELINYMNGNDINSKYNDGDIGKIALIINSGSTNRDLNRISKILSARRQMMAVYEVCRIIKMSKNDQIPHNERDNHYFTAMKHIRAIRLSLLREAKLDRGLYKSITIYYTTYV